jgi:hypothetical protein
MTTTLTVNAVARMLWVSAAAIVLGIGVGLIWWPSSQSIAQVQVQAEQIYERANDDDAALRRASHLREAAERIAQDVNSLSGGTSASATTASAIELLNRDGRAFGVDIRSLGPSPQATPLAAAGLTGIPLEVAARGHFRSLLTFVADLPRHDVLLDIGNVDLAGNGGRAPEPTVDAKIDLIVYWYHAPPEMENHAARTL